MNPSDNTQYRTILDAIPSPVFILDDDMRITDLNAVATAMSGQERENALRRRGGEVLHCLHSEAADVCGKAPSCKQCVIRNSVKACLKGQNVSRARMDFLPISRQKSMEWLITASPLPSSNERLAMLLIEDISKLSTRKSIIPRVPSQSNRDDLILVTENNLGTYLHRLPQKMMQCAACSQLTEYTDGHKYCGICGEGLSSLISESNYSDYEPNLVPLSHEIYYMKPTVRTINERRYPRIPCRNAKACIKTEQGSSVVVNVVNISRGGVCFKSVEDFCPGTQVLIATHYVEGGHNIYQPGRIIRAHRKRPAILHGEHAVEFLLTQNNDRSRSNGTG